MWALPYILIYSYSKIFNRQVVFKQICKQLSLNISLIHFEYGNYFNIFIIAVSRESFGFYSGFVCLAPEAERLATYYFFSV